MSNARNTPSLLIVEDDAPLRETFANVLRRRHYQVKETGTVADTHSELKDKTFDLILLDLTLPDGSGMEILNKISLDYRNRIIIISGTGTIDCALQAMRNGALDFLEKPVDRDVLLGTVKKALELNRAPERDRKRNVELGDGPSFNSIVYQSKAMGELVKKASESARSNKTILITGETGTGKELIAHAIHRASERWKKPFITVNCAAVPINLAESELFGFEKGAFTGADASYPGKFMQAHTGTIFLDEIGELHPEIQPKLLRVLESGEISSLKSTQPKKIDIRIIAATNKELVLNERKAEFRRDLYYRLEEITIHIPPLRERKVDIMPLVDHYIAIGNMAYAKGVKAVSPEARKLLLRYPWPGNVRELKNTIDEIIAFIPGTEIHVDHLPLKLRAQKHPELVEGPFLILEEVEKQQVKKALVLTDYNIQKSARMLGIGRPALYRKIKKYKLI
ncbi:MAG: sigma-54-dependent transcriptional regulator [Candidatus Omnitrophota bacterium]